MLSTFVFKKDFRKKIVTIIFVVNSFKALVLVGIMLAQRRRRWSNVISQLAQMYRVIQAVTFRGIHVNMVKRHPYGSQSKHGTITQFCFNVGPASNTIERH